MTVDNYLITLAKQTKILKAAAEDEIAKQITPIFDKNEDVYAISFLNPVTYDDEGYDMPSSDYRQAGYTIVINSDESDESYNGPAMLDAENFRRNCGQYFDTLFGAWDELLFSRQRGGKVELRVYEREY